MKPLSFPPTPYAALIKFRPETTEQRVVRQLLEALLFEKLVNYHYAEKYFYFNLGRYAFKAAGKTTAFGRIRLNSEKIFFLERANWLPASPLLIAENVPASEQMKGQLRQEIQQTLKLCQWNAKNLTPLASRRDLAYRELESAIHEGHPYHPCFKARTGFSTDDHVSYGPECANTFQLHWLALRRHCVHSQFSAAQRTDATLEQHHAFWQRELGPSTWREISQRLQLQQASWQEYRLMPAHPWQVNTLRQELQPAVANKDILDLGQVGDYYQASISVRTLLNISHPEKANIKLPLSMVNTSSLRTVEAHSIRSAPILSHWLKTTVDQDPFFKEQAPLATLDEYAGIRLVAQDTDKGTATSLSQLADKLGVIFRQSIAVQHNNNAVPFVALSVVERDNLPFIHPWIQRYGCEPWLRQFIKTSVIPVWHLLVCHGIAVEAHAQNMILIHEQGWPSKIILRDFHESLEYVDSFVKNRDNIPNFASLDKCYLDAQPDQYYWMSSTEALRELLADTLFVFNLTELSHLLERVYGYSEQQFWQQVYEQLQAYERAGHTQAARFQAIDLHSDNIQTESLLKRKLSGKPGQEFHHSIANALSHTACYRATATPNVDTDRQGNSHVNY